MLSSMWNCMRPPMILRRLGHFNNRFLENTTPTCGCTRALVNYTLNRGHKNFGHKNQMDSKFSKYFQAFLILGIIVTYFDIDGLYEHYVTNRGIHKEQVNSDAKGV